MITRGNPPNYRTTYDGDDDRASVTAAPERPPELPPAPVTPPPEDTDVSTWFLPPLARLSYGGDDTSSFEFRRRSVTISALSSRWGPGSPIGDYHSTYEGPPQPYQDKLKEAAQIPALPDSNYDDDAGEGYGFSIVDGPPDADAESMTDAKSMTEPHSGYGNLSARSDSTHAAEVCECGRSDVSAGSAGNISQQQAAADDVGSDSESKRPDTPTPPAEEG